MPIVQLPDGTELDFPEGMSEADMRGAIESNFPQFAAKPATERTWGQAAADTGAQLGEGVNNIIGAVPNLIAPEGDMAAFFNKSADYWRDQQSDPLKQKIKQADTAITAAGEDGMVAQISEAASQYFADPALAARFITTNLPSMIPGVGAAKVAQAAALARGATAARAAGIATTAAGGANAVLNAGGARGEAFEDIKSTLVKQGMTPEEAEQQAIADSRIVAAIGGAAGFISGKTGLEGAIAGKAGTGAAVRRGAGALTSELVGEQLEEVAPKLATNYQAGEYDGRDLSKDVGRTMVETAIGSGPGAIIGGVTAARAQPAADLPPINDQPASTVDDAVVAPAATWAEASGAAPAQEPAPAAPTIADIGAAGSVDEAIAAAQAVVASSSRSPHATAAEIDALEAQAGMTAGPRIPINDLDGIDLTAPQVWRQRPATQTWEAANAEPEVGTDAGAAGRGIGAGTVDAIGPPDGSGIVDAGRLPDAGRAAGAAPGAQIAVGGIPSTDAADPQPALTSRDKALAKIARQEEAVRLAAENIAARKAAREAAGKDDDDWRGFPADTGTLNVPRDTMPQIKAEHRGALTQFLNARGVTHEQVEIPSAQLKPTQAEFSLGKVRKAMEFTGGDRSILVSSDGHVLDGHHQWLAKVEQGQPVKAIRLNAPIRELLETVKEFPSAGVDTASAPGAAEQTTALARETPKEVQPKKSTGGQRARERIKASNPFLAFLASNGVSSEDRSDAGAERGRAGNPMVPGYGPVFRRSGLRFDELALAAQQAGFLTQADIDNDQDTGGTRKLTDMIARATQNKEVIRQAGSEDQATADERLRAEAEALGLDTNGATPDQLYDMVVSAHAALEEHRGVTGAASVDEQDQVEALADTIDAQLLIDADIPLDGGIFASDNITDEELDAIFGPQSRRSAQDPAGKTESDTAQPARESAAGTESTGDILGSYTREEVVARQEADEARAKARESERARLDAEAKKKRDKADVDARMDASADNFQLGQSADDALAGQNDLFSAPPPAAAEAEADDNADIPPAFYKKVKVPIEVYIEDEGAYETIDMPADKALASVREDIDNLRALVKCMGGKA